MIAFHDVVTLVETKESIVNGKVNRAETGTRTTAFAHVGSVSEREFYDAMQAGLELACRIIMWTVDYRGERIVEHSGQRYHIERTYATGRGTTELSCVAAKGRGNG